MRLTSTGPEKIQFQYNTSQPYLHRFYSDGRRKDDDLLMWSIAHEFRHVLGIDDYYVRLPGSSFDSIMNKVSCPVSNEDVEMLISAYETGEWTVWEEHK